MMPRLPSGHGAGVPRWGGGGDGTLQAVENEVESELELLAEVVAGLENMLEGDSARCGYSSTGNWARIALAALGAWSPETLEGACCRPGGAGRRTGTSAHR